MMGNRQWDMILGQHNIAYTVENVTRFIATVQKGHLEVPIWLAGYLKDMYTW